MGHRHAAWLLAFALAACGYGAPDEVVYGTAVATKQAPSTNFAQYSTYSVTDTIQIVDNTTGVPASYTKDAAQLVAEVKKNMDARGYTYVPFVPGVKADLVVGLYAYRGDQAYGGYYCGWYYWGYYPYGCSYYYYGEYKFGALVMQMADFKNAPAQAPGAEVPTVWGAVGYGVLSDTSYNVNKALESIDRAFQQSPYIQR